MYVSTSSFSLWGRLFPSNRKSPLCWVVVTTKTIGMRTYYRNYFRRPSDGGNDWGFNQLSLFRFYLSWGVQCQRIWH